MKLRHSSLWSVLATALLLNACALPEREMVSTTPASTTNATSSKASKAVAEKGDRYTATVIKVADGDTITVQDQHGATHKIRLAYIDAPEMKQNHGLDSQAALATLVDGKTVQVQVEDIDRYKREVAIITLATQDVNYRQIELGNAWHYTDYAKSQLAADFQRYQAAMAAAKGKKLGLWSFARPQAPWDYRKQQRQKAAQSDGE